MRCETADRNMLNSNLLLSHIQSQMQNMSPGKQDDIRRPKEIAYPVEKVIFFLVFLQCAALYNMQLAKEMQF